MDTTTTAVLSVPTIIALTTLAKTMGVKGRWATLTAVVGGVALGLAQYLLADSAAWQAASGGLMLGLSAAGVWDVARTIGPTAPAARTAPDTAAATVPSGWESVDTAAVIAQATARAHADMAAETMPDETDVHRIIAAAKDEALADAAGLDRSLLSTETGAGHQGHEMDGASAPSA